MPQDVAMVHPLRRPGTGPEPDEAARERSVAGLLSTAIIDPRPDSAVQMLVTALPTSLIRTEDEASIWSVIMDASMASFGFADKRGEIVNLPQMLETCVQLTPYGTDLDRLSRSGHLDANREVDP